MSPPSRARQRALPPFWRMSRLLGEPDRDAQNEMF
jgi:hypothetical protein